ncbi:hypothetical protein ACFYOK_06095 [Microbispora bryophytorum]|uniref:hypothetical protein n=1 Tax=Microbispora bryophytorum TaxID=1460882 RepID=UPI0033D029C4
MRDLPGFDAFAADHAQPLARTALALTGDPATARGLVVTALSAVAARWSAVRWSFPAHTAREALYRAYLKRPRTHRGARRRGMQPIFTPGTGTAALAEALTGLTPRRRALVVACFQDGHSIWQAAGLCRMAAEPARTETVLAVAELRHRLPVSFVEGTAPDETPVAAGGAGTSPRPEDDEQAPHGERPLPEGRHPEPGAPDPGPLKNADSADAGSARDAEDNVGSNVGSADSADAESARNSGNSGNSGSAGGAAAGPSPTSWAAPSDAAPSLPIPPASPYGVGQAAGAPDPYHATPSPTPVDTGEPRDDGPWAAALRRELAALSAAMPALDPVPLTAEAGRAGRRDGTRRRSLVTGMSVTLAALVVVPLAFVAAGVAERASRDAGASSGSPDASAPIPGPPPSSLPAPVRFAYRESCAWDQDTEEPADDGCAEWRLVMTTGEQWRMVDVYPGIGDDEQPPVAISEDGDRVAYFSEASSDFVVFDRLDTTVRRTGMVSLIDEASQAATHLVISPGGRWMAADFGQAAETISPRVQNLTDYRVSTLPRRMRVLAVGDDGTVTGTATWDTDAAPGRISTTELLRMRPNGRTLSRVPIDPALIEAGAAVSPNGRALAVAAERAHPREDDHGLVATLDTATGRVLTRHEAALPGDAHVVAVRGWASAREVIVEAERPGDDEYEVEYSLHAVDVRTGASKPIDMDEAGGVPGLWVPGALR